MIGKRLTKAFVATAMSVCLVWAPAISVLAAGNSVTITGEGGLEVNSSGLYDSNPANPTLDNNDYEIDVNAKVSGGAEIVYNIRVEWGAMQFRYDYGSIWDPVNHTYTAGESGQQGGGWVDACVDGVNNKITVINNSNFPVIANFSFTINNNALNANNNVTKAVTGIFSLNNSDFTSELLKRGKKGTNIQYMEQIYPSLEMHAGNLANNTVYYATSDSAFSNADTSKKDVYFALTGIPDIGGPTDYTSVGKIKISITPYPNATARIKQ